MVTLTVDDNESVRKLMTVMLKRLYPDGRHISADNAIDAMEIMNKENVSVIFLDIEMPGINGIDAANFLLDKFKTVNIIFITGHKEYAYEAHNVFCSGFLCKPISEADIQRAMQHLRFPMNDNRPLTISTKSSFTLSHKGSPFLFKREKTMEMFAYLVYRNGELCTNSELITVLWNGDIDKQGFLRQLVFDMRTSLEEIGMGDIIMKKRGAIGIDAHSYAIDGVLSDIPYLYGWTDF